MKHGMTKVEHQEDGAAAVTAHIVGSNRIQNELIATFLEERIAATCTRIATVPPHSEYENKVSGRQIVLLDCRGDANINPWSEYELEGVLASDACCLTFYNVHPDAGIEMAALQSGVCGIFYKNESVRQLVKGLQAILGGELWYSRRVMADLLKSSNGIATPKSQTGADLTRREREILRKIAAGANNQEISAALFISPHTVKSHIYSIYKKVNVNNRFQASLWAVRNLQKHSE